MYNYQQLIAMGASPQEAARYAGTMTPGGGMTYARNLPMPVTPFIGRPTIPMGVSMPSNPNVPDMGAAVPSMGMEMGQAPLAGEADLVAMGPMADMDGVAKALTMGAEFMQEPEMPDYPQALPVDRNIQAAPLQPLYAMPAGLLERISGYRNNLGLL